MGAIIAVTLGAGCDPDCSFDHVIDEEIDGSALVDCGDLPTWDILQPPPPEPWRTAHDCAVAAWSAQTPFMLRWRNPGFEGTEYVAFVSRPAGGAWSLTQLVQGYFTDGTSRPTRRYTCSALVDLGACPDAHRTLCLACADRTRADECGD